MGSQKTNIEEGITKRGGSTVYKFKGEGKGGLGKKEESGDF